jgi:hypothetical protein
MMMPHQRQDAARHMLSWWWDQHISTRHFCESYPVKIDRIAFFSNFVPDQLRQHPQKCAFGVTSGKLEGFLVSQRGKEVDPAKVNT